MLVRQLEPEFMDTPEEACGYDQMDHTQVNRLFVSDLLAEGFLQTGSTNPQDDESLILDLGTGTAWIPIELCRRYGNCRVVACDAAASMLELARLNVAVNLCEHRIDLNRVDAKQLEYSDDLFDGVMSNSLLHHLPEPQRGVSEMLRVCKPGGWLFIRDLLRPASADEVERLVAQYAADETPQNQQLLRQSLHAALTLEEVQQFVAGCGLPIECVKATSDRHWTLALRTPGN